ncbi:MAG: 50S ribosomal protein L18a [Candidatus Methanomethylicota archaeon]|uniref:Large ribosomal subunit protein eL20 n=1 Tax=Thermoproteota archaeon TaxID=2056631 RepID=A0A497EY09_9CREN|nr:MAG: 50S ribosomal protein L18a [Candidatus Verstraetearchaeota archaeon]RLE55908.1 MAG: 50S ribosomal protein L18a [Candidatus Verstraetearchaeota archaeon]
MSVKVFRVEGKMLLRTGEWQKFVIDLPGVKPEDVLERVYSSLTGLHKLKRSHIHIKSITVIPPEESKNPLINSIMELKMREQ